MPEVRLVQMKIVVIFFKKKGAGLYYNYNNVRILNKVFFLLQLELFFSVKSKTKYKTILMHFFSLLSSSLFFHTTTTTKTNEKIGNGKIDAY